jgi:hypothetical protein
MVALAIQKRLPPAFSTLGEGLMKQFGNLLILRSSNIKTGRILLKSAMTALCLLLLGGCATTESVNKTTDKVAVKTSSIYEHLLYERSQLSIQQSLPFEPSANKTYRVVTKQCDSQIPAIGLYYLDNWIGRRGLQPYSKDALETNNDSKTSADFIVVIDQQETTATLDFCDRDYQQTLDFGLNDKNQEATTTTRNSKNAKQSSQYKTNLIVLAKNTAQYKVIFEANFIGTPSKTNVDHASIFAMKSLASAWLKSPVRIKALPSFGLAFDILPNQNGQFYPVIMHVQPGSQAAKSGLLAGDTILEIDQLSMMNLSTHRYLQWAQQISTAKGVWHIIRNGKEQWISIDMSHDLVLQPSHARPAFFSVFNQQGVTP